MAYFWRKIIKTCDMDVIIVCHTEFGFVHNKELIADKKAVSGAREGVLNLIKVADKYNAKITFVVCPEVAEVFPKNVKHEIGLHIHPGWDEREYKGFKWNRGDTYLKEHCKQLSNSTILPDHSYEEQFELIKTGKKYLKDVLGVEAKVFVGGRWSINNDTVRALLANGLTHECSGRPHTKSDHYDWSKLPRICMPYNPDGKDYQKEGDLPLLITPISQTLFGGTVNPEGVITYGLPWLKASFLEYRKIGAPFFHICFHSPLGTDPYYISLINDFLSFISRHKNVNFRFASEINKYPQGKIGYNILPYITAINGTIIKSAVKKILKEIGIRK